MSSSGLREHECRVCRSSSLQEFDRFRALTRVTSDSRPWPAGGRLAVCNSCGAVQKLIEKDWLNDIGRIYETYAIYHQSGGQEQPIFIPGQPVPTPRSVALVNYLDGKLNIPAQAEVLDFGCGTGAALRTYSRLYPAWELYGAELSARSIDKLRAIPNFRELFTGPPADIPRRFDLITAMHAMEHVLDPVETIQSLVGLLKPDGTLFVQVPDVARTPYDLVIADHLVHFSLETLRYAAERAGCRIEMVTDAVLPKELTLMGHAPDGAAAAAQIPDAAPAIARVNGQIAWLVAQAQAAQQLAAQHGSIGIFGTSISGTWLGGILGDRVAFFVDEDEARIGGRHMDRPVLAAKDVPAGAHVFVPLVPEVAASVVRRLSRSGISLHAPPQTGEARTNREMANPW